MALILAKLFLAALGNRLIGSDTPKASNIYGYAFLSLGVWLGLRQLWALPLILIGVMIWRMPSARPWLDMTHTPDWHEAVARGSYIVPLIALLYVVTNNPLYPLFGALLLWAVPIIYYLTGKQRRYEPVALAEILTGAIIPLAFSASLL